MKEKVEVPKLFALLVLTDVETGEETEEKFDTLREASEALFEYEESATVVGEVFCQNGNKLL